MKVKMFELHQKCRDKVLKRKITLTHAYITGTGAIQYYGAAPFGQNGESLTPLDGYPVFPDRIEGADKITSVDVPVELIGTKVTDMASGIKGTATEIVIHPGGCVHVRMVPDGVTKDKNPPHGFEVDIRRLESPLLTKLSEEARKASEKKTPSPAAHNLVLPGMQRGGCAGFGLMP